MEHSNDIAGRKNHAFVFRKTGLQYEEIQDLLGFKGTLRCADGSTIGLAFKRDVTMIIRILTIAAAAICFSQTAFAQSSMTSSSTPPSAASAQKPQSLPQEIRQKLQRDGFTNIRVVPSSFLIQAKDKDGDPVTMMIGPNSMTMLTRVDSGNSTTGDSSSTSDGSGKSDRK